MRRIAVVANCASGQGHAEAERDRLVRDAFRGLPVRLSVRCTRGHQAGEAAREAAEGGADLVAAAGGDGTVSAVAAALAGTSTPMAVLPLGTLNHFAKDAGIPLPLEEAARLAATGVPSAVDVGAVNGHVFVNNSSIGIYPRAVHVRDQIVSESAASRRAAMLRASWRVLRRMPSHRVLLSVDGRPVVRTTSFVFVGNNRYETSFGRVGKRSGLDEGMLSVAHVRRPGRAAVLGLAARSLVGRLDGARHLQLETARRVRIESHRRELRVALDGEVRRLRTPLEYEVRPRSLLVVRP